jgi:hypothetical protein
MKKLIENFKHFLTEGEQPDFKFTAILISKSSKDRGKQEILSDIRSLPGVTVVAVREADKPQPGRDYSLLSIKIDRLILGHDSVTSIVEKVMKRVNRLEGVYSFTLKGVPERI